MAFLSKVGSCACAEADVVAFSNFEPHLGGAARDFCHEPGGLGSRFAGSCVAASRLKIRALEPGSELAREFALT
jgi:hypothetical protein